MAFVYSFLKTMHFYKKCMVFLVEKVGSLWYNVAC